MIHFNIRKNICEKYISNKSIGNKPN